MEFEAVKLNGKVGVTTPKLWADEIAKYPDDTKFIITIEKKTSRRTLSQNRALHKWFELVADALNEAGYSVQYVLKFFTVDIDWDKDSVKSLVWKPVQKYVTGKEHTADLDKHTEIDKTFEHLNRALGEKLHIHVPFPVDEEKQKEKQYLGSTEEYNYPTDYQEPKL